MQYTILLDERTVFQGNVLTFLLITVITIAVLVGIGLMIWKKIQENEVMKYEFITIIAHKFRTPLTQLKWLIEGLIESEQDSSNRENLKDMMQSTDHLINMTGTLIELTNADSENKASYQFEKVPICEVTRNLVNIFKNAFHEKNILLSFQCSEEEVYVSADHTRLEFVLQTLLENAYNYTPPGRQVSINVGHDGHKAIINVTDNGTGIAAEDIPRIFTKFYRTENAKAMDTEGFGVGLYFSQTIIHRFGGKIEVYSPGLDKGATFRIVLPRK